MATKAKWLTDRYKSTTKIVPFVTMKSLTPEVKEYIESQGEGSDIPLIELTNEQVVLNPTRYLFTEEQYNIIEASKVIAIKYESPIDTIETFLVFSGSTYPTYITTLRPFDDNIFRAISFKINKTTYVGTQILSTIENKQLYQHNIAINTGLGWSNYVRIEITTDSSEEINTPNKLYNLLIGRGHAETNSNISSQNYGYKYKNCYGRWSSYTIGGIMANTDAQNNFALSYSNGQTIQDLSNETIIDNVIPL